MHKTGDLEVQGDRVPWTCIVCEHSKEARVEPTCSCGGQMIRGYKRQARRYAQRKATHAVCGIVGVRDPAEEAETERRLRENREAVYR